jgi:hypothetical protein
MTQQLRMDLIEHYYKLYKERNLSRGHVKQFREKYIELSELWLELTDNERTAVNIRFIQDNLGAR